MGFDNRQKAEEFGDELTALLEKHCCDNNLSPYDAIHVMMPLLGTLIGGTIVSLDVLEEAKSEILKIIGRQIERSAGESALRRRKENADPLH